METEGQQSQRAGQRGLCQREVAGVSVMVGAVPWEGGECGLRGNEAVGGQQSGVGGRISEEDRGRDGGNEGGRPFPSKPSCVERSKGDLTLRLGRTIEEMGKCTSKASQTSGKGQGEGGEGKGYGASGVTGSNDRGSWHHFMVTGKWVSGCRCSCPLRPPTLALGAEWGQVLRLLL